MTARGRLRRTTGAVPWLGIHLVTLALGYVGEWSLLRGTWFRGDDFEFLANRMGPHPASSIWLPHNEHWSTGPILVWRLFYAWVGIRDADLYFAASLLMHVLTAHFVWRLLLRSGTRPGTATGLAASFVVLGAGWENITWAFQLGFMGSSALGLGAVLLCLRGTRAGYLGALAVSVVSLTFSGISLSFVLAAAMALFLRRQRLRAVALVLLNGTIYVVWYELIGYRADIPAHPSARAQRAAGATSWAWNVLGSAAGQYTSLVSAGLVLVLGLGAFLAVHLERNASSFRLPDGTAARDQVITVVVATATALIQVGSFAINRSDISPADSPRYLYFVIALLLPALGVALTAVPRPVGRPAIALLLGYLVVTQALTLVAQERQFENPQLRADVLGLGHLIADGEDVGDVTLFSNVTTQSVSSWVAQGKLGDLDDVSQQQVLDARVLSQITTTSRPPSPATSAEVVVEGTTTELAAGSCATATPLPGDTAAEISTAPGQTVQVTVGAATSLVYRVVTDGGVSRSVGVAVPAHESRWITSTRALDVQVVADAGQQLTFCVP